jgi:glycosyltransferase involved in cell wall biosynthesis
MQAPHEADLTLLVCTHNNAGLLARTLEGIARQQVASAAAWEVLVVANCCTDGTADVVRSFQDDPRLPAVVALEEPRPGSAYARKRGIAAARGRLIAFVDEDCLLAPDWVDRALEFADAHPRAGAFGGRNELEWESAPPELCVAYGESLARQDLGDVVLLLPATGRQVVCGAGLVLRREALVASRYVEQGCLAGRDPIHLGAGEDAETVLLVRQAGWEVWYAPSLNLKHYIPAFRMSLPYLCRLHRGFGRAEVYLRILAARRQPTLANRLRGLGWTLGELGRVVARFPTGFVRYVGERPTWRIRWHYAIGCLEGAVRLLWLGRAG